MTTPATQSESVQPAPAQAMAPHSKEWSLAAAQVEEASGANFSAGQPAPAQNPETERWALWVAGMVCGYLKMPVDDPRLQGVANVIKNRLWGLPRAMDAPATPSAASIAWNKLRDETDQLGEQGKRIMEAVRIFAQRQYECGLSEGAQAPAVGAGGAPVATCPTCKAPCSTRVNPRGGDYGWGTTDAERTVYRYAPPLPAAKGREPADALLGLARQITEASRDGDSDTHLSAHFYERLSAHVNRGQS